MRTLLLVALFSLSLSTPVRAQAGPEVVAQQYTDALLKSDFASASRLMHPVALRHFFELFEPLLEGEMFDELGPSLFGVSSRAELASAADTTLFASFLRNAIGKEPGMAEVFRSAKLTIFGHVPGGADTTLVVTRVEMSVEGVVISHFDVMPFARHDGQWRALLKADFRNMAEMMRRGMAPPQH